MVRRSGSDAGARGSGTPAWDPVWTREARERLARAEVLLEAAAAADRPEECIRDAYLAAIRAASAVLATRPLWRPRRGRPRDVWSMLADAEPGFARWAGVLSGYSAVRVRAEAGLGGEGLAEVADELYALVGEFIDVVEAGGEGMSGAA